MQAYTVNLTAVFLVEADTDEDVCDLVDNFLINNIDTHDYVRFTGKFYYSLLKKDDGKEKGSQDDFPLTF